MKIRALTASHTLPSFSTSFSDVSYSSSAQSITYSASAPDISYSMSVVPMTNLVVLSVTVSDSAPVFDVGQVLSETVTASEAVIKAVVTVFSNSVTVQDTSFRAFSASVDFDPSDSDLDPDPVSVSDSVLIVPGKTFTDSVTSGDSSILNPGKISSDSVTSGDSAPVFSVGQASSDSVTPSESVAKAIATPSVTDSVTPSESVAKAIATPSVADSVTSGDASVFSISQVSSDSVTPSESVAKAIATPSVTDSVTPSESVAKAIAIPSVADSVTSGDASVFSINQVSSDSVTVQDTSFRAFSASVDFDPSDSDLDPDPVSVSDSIVNAITKPSIADSVTSGDSFVLNPGKISSDSVTSGDSAPVFSISQVSSDSVSVSESVSTNLILGDTTGLFSYAFISDGPFVRTLFNAQAHYSNSNYAYEARTGMINGPGMIGNAPMFNDLFITYTQNDGFNIDFIYTSVDDRAINGYQLNETVMVGTSLNV